MIPEPNVAFPAPQTFYFISSTTESSTTMETVFSYDADGKELASLSSVQPSELMSTIVPLGKLRFSPGYHVIQEDDAFSAGSPDSDTSTQLGSIGIGSQVNCMKTFRNDGLGAENHYFVLHNSGPDNSCDSNDDQFRQISLASDVDSEAETISQTELKATPVRAADYTIVGYLNPASDGSIQLLDRNLSEFTRFTGLTTQLTTAELISSTGDLLLVIDGQLYLTNSDKLFDSRESLSLVVDLTSPNLVTGGWLVTDTTVYIRDGSLLRLIDREEPSASRVITDLASQGTAEGPLALATDHLVQRLADGRLLSVNIDSGAISQLAASVTDSYYAEKEFVYATDDSAAAPSALLLDINAVSHDCLSSTGCTVTADAQWWFINDYRENGVTTNPLLITGKADGAVPGYSAPYFNDTTLKVYRGDAGEAVLTLATIGGQTEFLDISPAQDSLGILSLRTFNVDKAEVNLSDVYLFDLQKSNSLTNISNSSESSERLGDPAEPGFATTIWR